MFVYFVGALLCLLFVEPACCRFEPDGPDSRRVLWWLLAPWLSLAALSLALHWRWWRRGSARWAAALAPFVLATLLAALTWPYLQAVNAVAGSRPASFGGEVVGRWQSAGRASIHGMRLRDARTGAVVSLRIDRSEYDALRAGDRAVCGYRRGRLGFYFRWRFGAQACRFERGRIARRDNGVAAAQGAGGSDGLAWVALAGACSRRICTISPITYTSE